MLLQESSDKSHIVFYPDTKQEARSLRKVPAFMARSTRLACINKPPIVYNVAKRLPPQLKKNLKVSPYVKELLDQDFTLSELPSDFEFHTQPLKHQLIALRYCYTTGNAGLLLDPGLGKTKVLLDFIHLMQFERPLVVCPKSLCKNWVREAEKHRPELNPYIISSTNWERELEQIKQHNLVIVNYAKAAILVEQLLKYKVDFLGLDEGLIKNYQTKRTKAMLKLSRKAKSRGILSGTLINNSVEDLYSPISFLEPTLVGTLTNFKNRYLKITYAETKQGRMVPVNQQSRHVEEARNILRSCCIVMKQEEWLDLPEQIFKDLTIDMTQEQKRVYTELVKNYIATVQGYYISVDNPLSLAMKLGQIGNGFLYIDENKQDFDDLFGRVDSSKAKKVKRKTLYFNDNPKIKKLESLLETDLKSRRFIIWYNMDAECDMIEESLKSLNIKYLVARGQDKKVDDKVEKFNNDNSIQILVSQARTINYGVTVLGYHPDEADKVDTSIPDLDTSIYTHVFYSLNWSLEIYLQQLYRSYRIGAIQSPEYYRLFAHNPTEFRVRDRLDERTELRESVLIDITKDIDLDSLTVTK